MILIFGPAGSGKSLQGEKLAKKHGWQWLSVGKLLRERQSPEIEEQLKGGELFEDEFVARMMNEAIEKAEGDGGQVILDGYPRSLWQAEWIVKNGYINRIKGAIVLEVPEDELMKRLMIRGRSDDLEETIKRRWEVYEQNICSIISLLKSKNVKIEKIDGLGSIEKVASKIEDAVSEWNLIEEIDAESEKEKEEEKSYGE